MNTARLLRIGLCALALSGLAGLAAAEAPAVRQIALPDHIAYPEGVAYDARRGAFYAGSAESGELVRIDATTGRARTIVPPGRIAPTGSTFPSMLGMKVDGKGRLWIAGGFSGLITLVDPASGRLLQQEQVSGAPKTLLNDLVVIGDTAYVTDTFVPILWRMRAGQKPEAWIDLTTTPIGFADGPNLNGITASADGRSLIVVQMNKGKLFHVDIASREVTPIDVGGLDLVGSDGLLLEGNTLYVVQQWSNRIVRLQMEAGLKKASLLSRYGDPSFVYPATVVRYGDSLVTPNSQFNRRDAKASVFPMGLARVPLSLVRRGN
ncbi:superoxide dismutase [Novosphingobium flavum]|uniref:Superoxide dismutase n=1 Tax=Novosphingobium flavum TaxID=1778672 RepID=A0A7X1FTT3_9SPHN|nr:superoxide dismutase [Novosphingobium flavum]MBC2666317.1 superoxide dismutase [Novosphingobium flavum]